MASNAPKVLEKNTLSIDKGVDLSNDLQHQQGLVSAEIQPLAHAMRDVSEASFEQTQAIKQISESLLDIEQSAQESQRVAHETTETAVQLKDSAERLMDKMLDMKS